MKTCLSNGLVEVLRTSFSALGLQDPRTSLCVTFLLWGYIKGKVYVSRLPANIDDMKDRITAAINTVNRDLLRRVREEFSHRLDAVRCL